MSGYKQVRRALLSVTDKTGLVPFARQLADHNIELVSTGGTAAQWDLCPTALAVAGAPAAGRGRAGELGKLA